MCSAQGPNICRELGWTVSGTGRVVFQSASRLEGDKQLERATVGFMVLAAVGVGYLPF